jgi:hypothetical protein
MDPNKIVLENLNKNFEYERIAREIDACDDVDDLKNIAKSYVKLHLKYQETLASLNFNNL